MDVKQAIETRRAYRSLAPVEISEEIVTELAQAAALAPSCNNKQPWRFLFAYDDEALPKIKEALSGGNKWATAASMIIAVISRSDLDCEVKYRPPYFTFDVGMATGSLILRATELGLVAHPIAGFSPSKVRKAFDIPDDMMVITLLNVGKWAGEVGPLLSESQADREMERPERLPLERIAMRNRYVPEPVEDEQGE